MLTNHAKSWSLLFDTRSILKSAARVAKPAPTKEALGTPTTSRLLFNREDFNKIVVFYKLAMICLVGWSQQKMETNDGVLVHCVLHMVFQVFFWKPKTPRNFHLFKTKKQDLERGSMAM